MSARTIAAWALLMPLQALGASAPEIPLARFSPDNRAWAARVWRTQDGLPENTIQALAQTPDGYLWIGTPGGLVRFDGAKFFVYNRANTPALINESVYALYTTPDGTLWIGTDGGGLFRFRDGSFERFGERQGITNGFIKAIYLDRQGTLWTSTAHGLFRLGAGGFTRVPEPPSLPVSAFWEMTERADCAARILGIGPRHRDRAGDLWIGATGAGLARVHDCAVTWWRAPDGLPGDSVNAIFEDRQGNMWIGAQDGLLRLSKRIVTTLGRGDGFVENNISTAYRDRSGTVWTTTVTGKVYRLAGDRLYGYALPQNVEDLQIRTIYQDSHANLPMGTNDHGFARVSRGHATQFTSNDGLRNNTVTDFCEDNQGIL